MVSHRIHVYFMSLSKERIFTVANVFRILHSRPFIIELFDKPTQKRIMVALIKIKKFYVEFRIQKKGREEEREKEKERRRAFC